MRRTNLHKAAYHAAMALHAQSVLRSFEATDIFAARVPGDPTPLIVTVLNHSEEELELVVVRGERALEQVMAMAGGTATDEVMADLDVISCPFSRSVDVDGPARQFVHRAGVRARSSTTVPAPRAREAGQPWRALLASETRDLFVVLRGMLLAIERGLLSPAATRRAEGLLTWTLSGDPLDPDLVVGWGEGSGGVVTAPVEVPPVMPIDDERLSDLRQLDQTWLVGCPIAPFSIDGSEEVVRIFIVLDKRSRRLIEGLAVKGPRWPYAAASRFVELLTGQGRTDGLEGVPSQVLLADRELTRILCPHLRVIGVTCRHEPTAEGPVTTAFESFLEQLEARQG